MRRGCAEAQCRGLFYSPLVGQPLYYSTTVARSMPFQEIHGQAFFFAAQRLDLLRSERARCISFMAVVSLLGDPHPVWGRCREFTNISGRRGGVRLKWPRFS